MELDTEKIIAAVAEKHRIILDRNDPVIATLAMHEIVLAEYTQMVAESVGNLSQSLEDISFRHTANSKQIAQNIVGTATDRAAKQLMGAGEKIAEQIDNVLQKRIGEIKTIAATTAKMRKTSVICASIAVVFSIISVFAFFSVLI